MRALEGRRALVTGASVGAGRAIAERLAADGAQVYVCARSAEALDSVVAAIAAAGGSAHAIAGDLTDPAHVARLAADLAADGGLDIFVNSLGGPNPFGSWDELDDAAWQQTFDFNVFTVVRIVRAVIPLLRGSAVGRIVLIGSTSALEPNRYNPHYAASKAALHNLAKYLAAELAPDRITVNVIAPATLESRSREENMERRSRLEGLPVEQIRARTEEMERTKIPLGRIGRPDEIAGLVAYLASDAAAWITGTTVTIDGGTSKSAW